MKTNVKHCGKQLIKWTSRLIKKKKEDIIGILVTKEKIKTLKQ